LAVRRLSPSLNASVKTEAQPESLGSIKLFWQQLRNMNSIAILGASRVQSKPTTNAPVCSGIQTISRPLAVALP
jgi:hypothetical protein